MAHAATWRPRGGGDTVAVAFQQSSYATPCDDHSIPGSHPAYRPPRRLGRQYAPQPLTYSQLTHALVAPFAEGVTVVEVDGSAGVVTATVDRVDAQRARAARACGASDGGGDDVTDNDNSSSKGGRGCCYRPLLHTAQQYVLNVRHGGKRHFAEPRSAEQTWSPSRRRRQQQQQPHVQTAKADGASHDDDDGALLTRKGRGVYNYERPACTLHPDAARAHALREQAAQRALAGKARVCCPPDHSVTQLGFYRIASAPATSSSPADGATVAAVAAHDATVTPLPHARTCAAAAAVHGNEDSAPGSGSRCDVATAASRMANVRFLGCQRADDDAVQQLQREACVLRRLRAAQRARVRAARTREDVQAQSMMSDAAGDGKAAAAMRAHDRDAMPPSSAGDGVTTTTTTDAPVDATAANTASATALQHAGEATAAASTTATALPLYEAPHSVLWDDLHSTSTYTQPAHAQQQTQPQQQQSPYTPRAGGDVVCAQFCRGHDNSHVNRMATGSYSRYLAVTGTLPQPVLLGTFYGTLPMLAYRGGRGGVARGSGSSSSSDSRGDGGGAGNNGCGCGGGGAVLAHASSTTPACAVRQRVTRYYGRPVRRDSTTAHTSTTSMRTTQPTMTVMTTASDAAAAATQTTAAATMHGAMLSSSQLRVREHGMFAGTLTHLQRRECRVLGPGASYELARQRDRRKRDPRHGSDGSRHDHQHQHGRGTSVYYSHLGRAYYVPHEPASDTLRLRYDDLYEFGDGTKFAVVHDEDSVATHDNNDVDDRSRAPRRHRHNDDGSGSTRVYTRNPHAPPPATYGEWRLRTLPSRPAAAGATRRPHRRTARERASDHSSSNSDNDDDDDVHAARSTAAAATTTYTSLRTATALDPHTLHGGRSQRTRTLEETLAARSACQLRSGSSLRRALIEGKLSEQQLPHALRRCCAAAAADPDTTTTTTTATTALCGDNDERSDGATVRPWHDSHPVKASTTTTIALQAPLAFTLRTDAGGVPAGVVCNSRRVHDTSPRHHAASAAAAAACDGLTLQSVRPQSYTISRLHYKQQYHPSTTPSAFVYSS